MYYVCMYVNMSTGMCICVCVCMCTRTHTHTHTEQELGGEQGQGPFRKMGPQADSQEALPAPCTQTEAWLGAGHSGSLGLAGG